MSLKTILFTHDDLDGAGSRIVYELAHQHLEKNVEYKVINCTNSGIDNEVMEVLKSGIVNKDTEICFADIVASRETLEYIVKNFNTPRIWDHHRTNFFATHIVPSAVIIPENELGIMQSGTSLIYQHYCALAIDFPDDPRAKFVSGTDTSQRFLAEFVDTIRSYDTYEWKSTNNLNAKKLQTLFSLLGMERFCDQYVKRLSNIKSDDIILLEDLKFVDAKLEREQNIIDTVTPDDVYHINVRGLNTAFSIGGFGVNGSELAYQFLKKYPEFDMFAIFDFWSGGTFSFRAIRDDLDIGRDVALPIGGGGHAKSSGAPLPDELRDQIIDILINHMNKGYEYDNSSR